MNLFKSKKNTINRDTIPASAEQAIPIQTIYEDGICLVGRNLWSKTYRFSDINYAVASKKEKEELFFKYCDILNALDSGATTKFTINNRQLHRENFEKDIKLSLQGDGYDFYRNEYNGILEKNAKLSNGIIQDKYLTVTVEKKSYEEARNYFTRSAAEFSALFSKLGSNLEEVLEAEKLGILFEFYHTGREEDFRYDREACIKRGHSFKDAITPDSFEFQSDFFKMNGRYGRALYLREYANFIKDDFVSDLTNIDRSLMLSIDADPMPMDKAVRQSENKLLAVETNITNWQRKQNQNNNYSAVIPFDLERQRNESREFLNDLVARDQRMIPALITLVHTADTKEKLDADTESIMNCARKHLCSLSILRWQQLEGLNTALPFGGTKIEIRRTLTTESLAVLMPFRVQEVCHKNGIYLGNNAINKNMIIVNRGELLNGNSFITGVSGSGKSILAKQEIISLYLSDSNADIVVVDPEREYRKICDALGGQNIIVSAVSKNHINAMDMNRDYADGANPVTLKSEFILSLCEQLMSSLGPKEKSVIDRCTSIVYRNYLIGGCKGEVPTFNDFRKALLSQPEQEAQEVALSLELFTNGSLDTFAKPTNVDTQSRFVCYDIHELGKQLQSFGMLVLLDSILNRITANRAKGRKTYIFLDEIYLLFQHEYSANFLFTLWKRVRKYGAFITGITQNVEDMLQSHTARTMLANSELVVMLNQAATDREQLAELMGISELQMNHITGVEAGHGLAKVGSALVPFINHIPNDTKLYELMTTKFGE